MCEAHPADASIERAMEAVVEEWEAALIAGHVTADEFENLEYILYEEAGSSQKTFQFGWKRDCATNGMLWGDGHNSRIKEGVSGQPAVGMKLEDFLNRCHTDSRLRQAKLNRAHVYVSHDHEIEPADQRHAYCRWPLDC